MMHIKTPPPIIKTPKITKNKNRNTFRNKINLIAILLFSNATLLQTRISRYGCVFCKEHFTEPAALKQHNLSAHSKRVDIIRHCTGKIFDHVIKVDITALACRICERSTPKLSDLMGHLKIVHKKELFAKVRSQLIPFKFDTEKLTCIVCKNEYATFRALQEHMNSHFANYLCEECGAGFVTERLRAFHKKTHEKMTGEYKCEQCEKTFPTEEKRRLHVKRTHVKGGKVIKCNFCEERFIDYWKKMEHLVEAHGMPSLETKCDACGAIFRNRKMLNRHTRRDHLLERNYACDKCGKTFFEKVNLEVHATTHMETRDFKCDICPKSYKRIKSLTDHMRIHTGLTKHNCGYCEIGFIQKATWRTHMRAKHGEEV